MPLAVHRELSLAQLAYFATAARCGSMTAAADELFVAQSAISTAIANLERSFGVQLFIRRRAKGLQLTDAGADLLGRARQILGAAEDALDALRPESTSGRVGVGCFRTLAPFYLPSIIRGLGEAYPDLMVQVTELTADQVNEALGSRAVDVALTYDLALGPEVRREVLATVRLYAAVAKDHPLAERESVSLARLADEPFVLLDLPASRDYFIRAFTRHGLRPHVRYRFGNFETVRAMVASGHGFTLLSQRPPDITYLGTELHRLRIEEDLPPLDLVLAWPDSGGAPSRKAELFAAECRRSVAGTLRSV